MIRGGFGKSKPLFYSKPKEGIFYELGAVDRLL